MKPIKFKKKLRFHKETIADLRSKEMTAVHGGQEADRPKCSVWQTECSTGGSNPLACCAFC